MKNPEKMSERELRLEVIELRHRLELQERIHVSTIRDLQAAALQFLTYPYDGERQGLESAVKASLCIVPLEPETSHD